MPAATNKLAYGIHAAGGCPFAANPDECALDQSNTYIKPPHNNHFSDGRLPGGRDGIMAVIGIAVDCLSRDQKGNEVAIPNDLADTEHTARPAVKQTQGQNVYDNNEKDLHESRLLILIQLPILQRIAHPLVPKA